MRKLRMPGPVQRGQGQWNAYREGRRQTIATLLALGAAFGPLNASAQRTAARPARIGFLVNFSPESGKALIECFQHGLRDLGWNEGKNINLEYRWAAGMSDRYPGLAAELVRLNPDLLVANSTPAAQAVQRATTTISIVFIAVSDPVASGIVSSLARPGANISGVSNFLPATTGKLLEFLKIAAPNVSRVGVLHNPSNPGKIIEVQELRAAAQSMAITIEPLEVRSSGDFDRAFSRAMESRCDALLALQEGLTLANRARITEFTKKHRLPAIFQIREFVEAGGLMSYGLNYCDHFQRAAVYVDKILKGARPAELPVELPTSFELLINLKTAKAINLKIPQSLLVRANEVLE